MELSFKLQLLISGFTLGIIFFQTALSAPIVFGNLKPDQSKIYIRKIFPKIFSLLTIIGSFMLILNFIFGINFKLQYYVSLTTIILPLVCLWMIPATNNAKDENNKSRFRFLHALSVILTMSVFLINLIWIFFTAIN